MYCDILPYVWLVFKSGYSGARTVYIFPTLLLFMSAAKSTTKVKAAFKFQTSFNIHTKIYNLFESSNELMALFSSIDKALITKTHKVNWQRLRYNILSIFLVLAKYVLHAVSHMLMCCKL